MNLVLKVATARRLGLLNVIRALSYRLRVRVGIHPACRISANCPEGPFYSAYAGRIRDLPTRQGWWIHREAYGERHDVIDGAPPDWHEASSRGAAPLSAVPWWKIPDFDSEQGDIKDTWEASRFDWALACAQQAVIGNPNGLQRLNSWLMDWVAQNRPYFGANWKCGQEASIRVMHLAMTALVLGQHSLPLKALRELVKLHLKRIEPTIQYAIAQDNNHGSSEAAALFIGGSWLRISGDDSGAYWESQGRDHIEERVSRLVEPDGTFSQYSVNYQRLFIDTLSMVEAWRGANDLPAFSPKFQVRALAATEWLANLVTESTGDAPNLGANDGARLLPLTDTAFRDFRPTVQLAGALFAGARFYRDTGSWDLPQEWLGIKTPQRAGPPQASRHSPYGGFTVLRKDGLMLLLRYPSFRFRPSHSDILHIDFWEDGENLFRDGGSFSYADSSGWTEHFSGVEAHNTVQFDGRDQMPRLGRFLFGAWPGSDRVEPIDDEDGELSFAAGYTDWRGASHHRYVALSSRQLRVIDKVSGFKRNAVLRWRLTPGSWHWENDMLTDGRRTLSVLATTSSKRTALAEGWESRLYGQMTALPVMEFEVDQPCSITTTLTL